MKTIGYTLEKEINELEYISGALTVMETALSPDNGAGVLNSEIIHYQLWHLQGMMDNTLKRIKAKGGIAYE